MSSTALPYSVSTGSAFAAFDKPQGVKNDVAWKKQSLRQLGVVTGAIRAPVAAGAADAANPTADEVELDTTIYLLGRRTAIYKSQKFTGNAFKYVGCGMGQTNLRFHHGWFVQTFLGRTRYY